jgi:hypothetical protein
MLKAINTPGDSDHDSDLIPITVPAQEPSSCLREADQFIGASQGDRDRQESAAEESLAALETKSWVVCPRGGRDGAESECLTEQSLTTFCKHACRALLPGERDRLMPGSARYG